MIDLDAFGKSLQEQADRLDQYAADPESENPEALRCQADGVRWAAMMLRNARAAALPDPGAPSMPAMNNTPTTQAMRRSAWPRSGTLRLQILHLLQAAGDHGFTDDELEVRTGRAHQSVSASRHGLRADGWLMPRRDGVVGHVGYPGSLVERPTRSGNMAQVWVLTPAARERLRQP